MEKINISIRFIEAVVQEPQKQILKNLTSDFGSTAEINHVAVAHSGNISLKLPSCQKY